MVIFLVTSLVTFLLILVVQILICVELGKEGRQIDKENRQRVEEIHEINDRMAASERRKRWQ